MKRALRPRCGKQVSPSGGHGPNPAPRLGAAPSPREIVLGCAR